jgi:hypothetical protein
MSVDRRAANEILGNFKARAVGCLEPVQDALGLRHDLGTDAVTGE